MKEEAKERLAKNIESAYAREQFPRDAAFSNASLAAMQLMLAAKATGWDTCAIGGFNPQALTDEFNVSSRYVPIMLITIGESTLKGHPAPRMSVEQVSEGKYKNEGNYIAFVFIPCHNFVILLQIIRHLYLWKSIFYSLLINKRDVSCRILLSC